MLYASCMTTANFEEKYDSWIGADISELTSAWGTPRTTNTTKSGKKEYGYDLSRDGALTQRQPE